VLSSGRGRHAVSITSDESRRRRRRRRQQQQQQQQQGGRTERVMLETGGWAPRCWLRGARPVRQRETA